MEIIRTYSSDDGENLYTCLMSEEELTLFSELKEETKSQKRKRQESVAGVASLGTGIGIMVGSELGKSKAYKIAEKANKIGSEVIDKHNELANRINNFDMEARSRGFKDKKTRDYYVNEVKPKILKTLDSYKQRLERVKKSSAKMQTKAVLKGTAKGALIGTGIGTAVALGLNHKTKKSNKKKSKK